MNNYPKKIKNNKKNISCTSLLSNEYSNIYIIHINIYKIIVHIEIPRPLTPAAVFNRNN